MFKLLGLLRGLASRVRVATFVGFPARPLPPGGPLIMFGGLGVVVGLSLLVVTITLSFLVATSGGEAQQASPDGQRRFSCGHFWPVWDEHQKCPSCRVKEGRALTEISLAPLALPGGKRSGCCLLEHDPFAIGNPSWILRVRCPPETPRCPLKRINLGHLRRGEPGMVLSPLPGSRMR